MLGTTRVSAKNKSQRQLQLTGFKVTTAGLVGVAGVVAAAFALGVALVATGVCDTIVLSGTSLLIVWGKPKKGSERMERVYSQEGEKGTARSCRGFFTV